MRSLTGGFRYAKLIIALLCHQLPLERVFYKRLLLDQRVTGSFQQCPYVLSEISHSALPLVRISATVANRLRWLLLDRRWQLLAAWPTLRRARCNPLPQNPHNTAR